MTVISKIVNNDFEYDSDAVEFEEERFPEEPEECYLKQWVRFSFCDKSLGVIARDEVEFREISIWLEEDQARQLLAYLSSRLK